MRRLAAVVPVIALLLLSACDGITGISDPDAPQELTYRLEPSGDPYAPAGILLTWAPSRNNREVTYDVYGRSSRSREWQLRATTTSFSFHDAGIPQAEYYVSSVNEEGEELGRSQTLTVDERFRLPAPGPIASTSLNGAVHLAWAHYAGTSVQAFETFRVYSAPHSGGQCSTTQWSLEGSTVSNGFLSTGLVNGASRCFAISGVSVDGHESVWSAVRVDTPRPDAKAVLLHVAQARADAAAFIFHDVGAQRFGAVVDTARVDADFLVERRVDGSIWLRPVRLGVEVVAGTAPVSDLTAIDRAPAAGYSRDAVQVKAGFAYVFRLRPAGSYRYGVVRVVHATSDLLVVDWAYQPAADNPELRVITAP